LTKREKEKFVAQERVQTQRIREHVASLATGIGERNLYQYDHLVAAASFIDRSWTALGYQVKEQI
jgi:hypothetical protein